MTNVIARWLGCVSRNSPTRGFTITETAGTR